MGWRGFALFGGRLERQIAMRAAAGALIVSLLFAAAALASGVWLMREQQIDAIEGELSRAAERLSARIEVFLRASTGLSANPVISSALVDSRGREAYLNPFLGSFRLPVPASHSVTLCDFQGKPLAGTHPVALDCLEHMPEVASLFAHDRPVVTMIRNAGATRLALFQPVIYPASGHAEGYLLAILDLQELLSSLLPAQAGTQLRLDAGAFHLVFGELDASARPALTAEQSLQPGGTAFGLDWRISLAREEHWPEGLSSVLAAFGGVALVTVVLAFALGRRMAKGIAAPILELRETARRIEREGPAAAPADVAASNEIGDLAASFNAMLDSLRRVHDTLEAQVAERTAALRQSEELFRTVSHYTYDWEYWIAPDRAILFMSPSCSRFTGYEDREFVARPDLLDEVIFDDDRPLYQAHLCEALVPVGATDAQAREIEFRIRARSGEIRWVGHVCRPVFDEHGAYLGRRVSNRDISERKRAEAQLRALNEELEKRVQERTASLRSAMAELESFSYSASHDLRTPLRGIEGFSAILGEEYADTLDDQGRHYLSRIRLGAQRMAQLIDEMLDLSRISRGTLKLETCDLTAIARSVAEELRTREPDREVTVRIAPNLCAVADAALMRSALTNLIGNAWKFSSKSPQPLIEIGRDESLPGRPFFVRDNGVGFDMAYADKLFKPFQRLHGSQEFEGTGIGLASVARVVVRHSGSTWAQSEPGQGATFYFTLGASEVEGPPQP